MKKSILFITAALFFAGCSTKSVTIPYIQKPQMINSAKVRNIKISTIKNDKIGLKEHIIDKMEKINQVIPGFFIINSPDYTSVLKGNVKFNYSDIFYTKIVPIHYKTPACAFYLYKCTSINGSIFCKNTPSMKLFAPQYQKILKNAYKKGNYIFYKKTIYKTVRVCKPTKAKLKCEKQNINIKSHLVIYSKNSKILFQKTYYAKKTIDPCKYIHTFEGKKVYEIKKSVFSVMNSLSNDIATEFIDDIAPHMAYIQTDLYTKPDVKMNSKDENIFENVTDGKYPVYKSVELLKTLFLKYPKSCVIKYDYGIYLIYLKKYDKATNILRNVAKTCNKDIKNSAYSVLSYLQNAY
jgi:hypothetical protein